MLTANTKLGPIFLFNRSFLNYTETMTLDIVTCKLAANKEYLAH